MRCVGFPALSALVLLTLVPAAALAGPAPATRLTEALGGTLDNEVGESGGLARPIDEASIVIRPGRSIEYRRRVAAEAKGQLFMKTVVSYRSKF